MSRPFRPWLMLFGVALALSAALNVALVFRYRVPPRIWNYIARQKEPVIPRIPLRRHLPIDKHEPALAGLDSSSIADLPEWKTRGRLKLRELLGVELRDQAVPVRLVRTEMVGRVIRETLIFEQEDGLDVPAFLLRPVDAPPRPAVIVIPGHSAGIVATAGIAPDFQHSNALRLAQAGYVVLTMEVRGFGYLSKLDNQQPAVDKSAYLGINLTEGLTPVGVTVRDAHAGINYLLSRPNVRSASVGVVGFSSGCVAAIFLAALDNRVHTTVASSCVSSQDASFRFSLHDPYSAVPGISKWFDTCDILGLISPRPVQVQWGALDVDRTSRSAAFGPSALHMFALARGIFAADGAPDNIVKDVNPDLGHEFDLDAATDFLLHRLPF